MDIRPISAVHVMPSASASVFMELLTLHAPVPHERNIIPTRPITDAFSAMLESTTGNFSPDFHLYTHARLTSIWFFLITSCGIFLTSSFYIVNSDKIHPLCYLLDL